mgnify:CR=1 FL=1
MNRFKNRLLKQSQSTKTYKPLKGEKLVDYVKNHKEEFHGEGDALCVSAGYGNFSEEGKPHCNFEDFVKELGEAMDLDEEVTQSKG